MAESVIVDLVMKIKKGANYKIYGLCHPNYPDDVLYVGATCRPLERRLAEHIASKNTSDVSKWCQYLKTDNKIPLIRELEECSAKDAPLSESKWTGYFKFVGHLNQKHHKFLELFHGPGYYLTDRLKKWRGELTQKEAADLLGVSVSTYCNWEYGINKPSVLAMREVDRIINLPKSK